MLVNRSVLCNYRIEVENNFLLESLAACHDAESKLVMYYTVNIAFGNYFDNLTHSLKFPISLNRTSYEQTLPISLQSFKFDSDLLKVPRTLKDYAHQFQHKKEIFDLKERHNDNDLDLANKNVFFNNYTVGIFSVSYCYNFISDYNNSHVCNMQTDETKISSSQPCFTANKRSRCSS